MSQLATMQAALPIRWRFDPSNPLLPPGRLNGALDAKHAGACHVFRHGEHYHLYYWAKSADGVSNICRAIAHVDEPNTWQPRGSVLEPQPDSMHNSGGPSFPHVLPVDDKYWLMYLGCWGRWQKAGRLPNTTALAISEDGGETWRYHSDTYIVPLDRHYDQNGTGSVWVMIVDGVFRMYYTAIGEYFPKPAGVRTGHGDTIPHIGIAYAESDDGIHWHKPYDDLMVSPRGFGTELFEYISSKPCVVVEADGSFRLFLNTFGYAYRVRSLHSSDGLDWTWNRWDDWQGGYDGEFSTGTPGSFDDHQRSYPCVLREGDTYHAWYTGNGFGNRGMGYAVGARDT